VSAYALCRGESENQHREPCRSLRDPSRPGDELALLDPGYDRFREGFETADLKSVKLFLTPSAMPNKSSGRRVVHTRI